MRPAVGTAERGRHPEDTTPRTCTEPGRGLTHQTQPTAAGPRGVPSVTRPTGPRLTLLDYLDHAVVPDPFGTAPELDAYLDGLDPVDYDAPFTRAVLAAEWAEADAWRR